MTKLPYLTACLRETLRLTPTAPAVTLKPVTGKGSQLLGGKYELEEDQNVMALLYAAHRDKTIYGEDAMEFKPERMLDEKFNALPRNAWKVSMACVMLIQLTSPNSPLEMVYVLALGEPLPGKSHLSSALYCYKSSICDSTIHNINYKSRRP